MNNPASVWLDYVERKIATAVKLNDGECGGSYSDACVLLSTLISGMAAELWPGRDKDKARFVEVWVRYSSPSVKATMISVPILQRFLRKRSRRTETSTLERMRPEAFGPGEWTRVLAGPDVDATEAEVKMWCPALDVTELREHSYPSIFYKNVRSNLVHEHRLSPEAASVPMTRRAAGVSYVNRADSDEPLSARRLIHFHFDWLAQVT